MCPSTSGAEPAPAPALVAARHLDALLRSYGPDVRVETASGTRRYGRADGRLFCVLRVLRSRVDVGFLKLGRARHKRILHGKGRLPFMPYLVEVEAPGDLDHELRAWLRESYDLAQE